MRNSELRVRLRVTVSVSPPNEYDTVGANLCVRPAFLFIFNSPVGIWFPDGIFLKKSHKTFIYLLTFKLCNIIIKIVKSGELVNP